MIELAQLDIDEETETAMRQFARLRIGTRKFDGKIVAAVSVWKDGVLCFESVDFGEDCPLVKVVWPMIRDGFRLAHHNEQVDWKSEQLRHG